MIFIILPVHNRKNITEKFIKCLVNQTYQKFKLIVVDDGSKDGTDQMVLSYIPDSKIIYGDGNLWWAGSLQKAYDWLKKQNVDDKNIILIINDDTEFNDNFLKSAVNILEDKEKTLLKAWGIDKYSNIKGDGYIKADVDKMSFEQVFEPEQANCASTRGLFLRFDDWFDIGGFYPDKLPHYWSDYEFTIRACRKGYSILCDDKLILYSDSSETGYHQLEYNNFLEFIKKYFSHRNVSHPLYKLNFINLMSTNKKARAYYSLQTIYHMTRQILKALFSTNNLK